MMLILIQDTQKTVIHYDLKWTTGLGLILLYFLVHDLALYFVDDENPKVF